MTMPSIIAVLGAGTMGGAIIDGLVERGETADGIRATNRTEAKAAPLRSENVESFARTCVP
jgi:pyrroline-5-carboxylate reductase